MEACDKVSPRPRSLGVFVRERRGVAGGKLLVESVWLIGTEKNPVFLEFLLSKPAFYHHLPATCPPGIIFGHSDPFGVKKHQIFRKIYTQKYGDKREKNFENRKWGPKIGKFWEKPEIFEKPKILLSNPWVFFEKSKKPRFQPHPLGWG